MSLFVNVYGNLILVEKKEDREHACEHMKAQGFQGPATILSGDRANWRSAKNTTVCLMADGTMVRGEDDDEG